MDGRGFGLNSISTRPVFAAIKQLWTGQSQEEQLVVSCKELGSCYACVTSFFAGETEVQLKGRCGEVCGLGGTPERPVENAANPDSAVIVGCLVASFGLLIGLLVAAIVAQKRCRRRDEKLNPQFVALH